MKIKKYQAKQINALALVVPVEQVRKYIKRVEDGFTEAFRIYLGTTRTGDLEPYVREFLNIYKNLTKD